MGKLTLKNKISLKSFLSNSKTIVILIIILLIFIISLIFKKDVLYLSKKAFDIYGLLGLAGITFIMDLFIQPFSPDLLTLSSTIGGANILLASLFGGFSSTGAGVAGYFIGETLIKRGLFKGSAKNIRKGEKLFKRYGQWAVVVGALTPVPYSAICWAAGIYGMEFKKFLLAGILARIPRFFIVALIGSHFSG